MALGTIGITTNGEVFLEPNILFKDRLSIIANISSLGEKDETIRNFWVIIAILGSIYIGRRIFKYQKKHDLIAKVKKWWN